MLHELFIVAVSGSIGAIARHTLGAAIRSQLPSIFPIATLAVNVSGCFAMGLLMSIVERQGIYNRQLFLIGAVGFLGSFTTFSAFSFESYALMRAGEEGLAFVNVCANLVLGFGAVWAGRFSLI